MDGSSSYFVNSLRSAVLAVVAVTAVLTLAWMYTEQSKINACMHHGLHTAEQVHAHYMQASRSTKHTEVKNYTWNYNWDMKQWPRAADAHGVPTRTLLLIRHGKYSFKTGDLDDKGRQQAEFTGRRLRSFGHRFGSIVHSGIPRAKQTADLLHRHLGNVSLRQDHILGEGGPAAPDPTVTYWGLPARAYHVDGPRLESAFRKYFYRADKQQRFQSFDVLVGHGNIFRYFVLRALQLPVQAWMRFFIAHASITLLHINPDGTVTMSRLGDSGHLPTDLVTY